MLTPAPSGRLRHLLGPGPGPRLTVFETTLDGTPVIAVRFSSGRDRLLLATCFASGIGLALFGVLADTSPGVAPLGFALAITAGAGAWRRLVLARPELARAAVRAALVSGHRLGARRWRVDGPLAVELDKELKRLASWWVPGGSPALGLPVPGEDAASIAAASATLAPHVGELTQPELAAWNGTDSPTATGTGRWPLLPPAPD